jgi:hypothetical protein
MSFISSSMTGATCMVASFASTDHLPKVNNVGCKNEVDMSGMPDYLMARNTILCFKSLCDGDLLI